VTLPLHLPLLPLLPPLLPLLPLLPLPYEEEEVDLIVLIVAIDRKIMILFHDGSKKRKKACATERAVGILLGPESTTP
jgi:hypothetical protein